MLEWPKKDNAQPDRPMGNAASAVKTLAEMRGADPLTALSDLGGWLDMVKGLARQNETGRSEVLSQIQVASDVHVSALLAQFLARPTGKRGTIDSSWKTLSSYLTALTGALHASARLLLKGVATNPPLQLAAATDAARFLHAGRLLAKVCLIRYLSVPPKLWRLAYAMQDEAERAGCATTPIRLHPSHKSTTTVSQELLRLLMLQSCAPEMLAPEQIEVADRLIEQLGQDFTLRPRGVTDNPFCFDPSSDRPPHRAPAQPQEPNTEIRYFGPGAGLDALERLLKHMATFRTAEIKALGALGGDIAPHAQISAIRHLLAFWGASCPYTSPARSPTAGELRVIHGYSQVWQHLSCARSGTRELALLEDGDTAPSAPETWTLQEVGGDELGADIPQAAGDWARCGDVVAVSRNGTDGDGLGVIRSMHAEWGGRRQANIAILSRDPQAVQLRVHLEKGEESAYSEEAAQAFAFNLARAIILSDGSAAAQTPNLLLPPESWKEGRIYEASVKGSARQLRGLQLLRRGDDYVRATFEWVTL